MAPIEPAKIRNGTKLVIDGGVYNVVEFAHTKPGKGQAFVRAKVKNLQDGRLLEKTWKIGETLQTADFEKKTCQYLYKDEAGYHFMDLDSFEQFALQDEDLGDSARFLQDETEVVGSFFEGKPIDIEMPAKLTFEVVDTIDAVKGNTATQITKAATLDNGVEIQVPPFIKTGDKVVVNTETGEYVERA